MEIKGFCQLKSTEHCFIGHSKKFDPKGYAEIEKDLVKAIYLPIIDIAVDGKGFLVIDPKGRALVDTRGMEDVRCWFKCKERGGVILPVLEDEAQLLLEMSKRLTRKGGYNQILRGMVILNSLRKGEFNDDFLFEKQ